jgi:hypothetical protein
VLNKSAEAKAVEEEAKTVEEEAKTVEKEEDRHRLWKEAEAAGLSKRAPCRSRPHRR